MDHHSLLELGYTPTVAFKDSQSPSIDGDLGSKRAQTSEPARSQKLGSMYSQLDDIGGVLRISCFLD